MTGREVMTLARGSMDPGTYAVTVNAAELQPGSYFCVLQTPTERLSRRIVIVK